MKYRRVEADSYRFSDTCLKCIVPEFKNVLCSDVQCLPLIAGKIIPHYFIEEKGDEDGPGN